MVERSYDGAQNYMDELSNYKVLSREEERALIKKAQEGDEEARDSMILHNMRLVIKVANKYASSRDFLEDMINEGYFGLVKSIEDFDLTRKCKFSTYAIWKIKQKIGRAIIDESLNNSPVRIPVSAMEKLSKCKTATYQHYVERGKYPSVEEIEVKKGLSREQVESAKNCESILTETYSLDETCNTLSDNINNGSMSRNSSKKLSDLPNLCTTVEDKLIHRSNVELILSCARQVDMKDRDVNIAIEYLGSLTTKKPKTVKDIGDNHGFSGQNVSRILVEFKSKLAKLIKDKYPDLVHEYCGNSTNHT